MESLVGVIRRLMVAALCTVLLACGGGEPTQPAELPPPQLSESARQYLNQVVDLLRDNSVRRHLVDWDDLRETVMRTADGAQRPLDTHAAIRLAFGRLWKAYNAIRAADGRMIVSREVSCFDANGMIRASRLPTNVGYIKVQDFVGDEDDEEWYATSMQAAIRAADREGLAGWIVDLRGATGLNHWPMLAGLGPILGEGVAGSFVELDGSTAPWEYHHGAASTNAAEQVRVAEPYTLMLENPRVAVLVDRGTAIAGEAIAIAFMTRPNARSFGYVSCGLSHPIKRFTLFDGSVLYVASGTMADRSSTKYFDGVNPEEYIVDYGSMEDRAIDWVQGK